MIVRSESRLGRNPSPQTKIKPLSGGASWQPENVLRPSKGLLCLGAAPNRGFSLRRQGALALYRISGKPRTERIQALADPLTTWSSMRANEYLDHRPRGRVQKRERRGPIAFQLKPEGVKHGN